MITPVTGRGEVWVHYKPEWLAEEIKLAEEP
jgi:hypothetical protein